MSHRRWPIVNDIKLFFFVTDNAAKQAGVFVLGKFFSGWGLTDQSTTQVNNTLDRTGNGIRINVSVTVTRAYLGLKYKTS